jgi:hypothetical protein
MCRIVKKEGHFMLEKYKPMSTRLYRSEVIGMDTRRHKITKGAEYYQTPSGTIEINEWVRLVTEAAAEDGLSDLLEGIKQYIRENCAWIHKEKDVEERAAECLIHEAYKHWDDFTSSMHGGK